MIVLRNLRPRLAVPALTIAAVAIGLHAAAAQEGAGVSAASGHAWLNPMSAIGRTSLKSFVEAPLFDPSRRLPPPVEAPVFAPPPPPPPPPLEPPPNVHLLGVILGVRDVAIVRQDETKTVMLHTGDQIGSWKVEVLPTGLRLRSGDRVSDFTLFAKSNTPAGQNGFADQDPDAAINVPQQRPPPPSPPPIAMRNGRMPRRSY